MVSANAVFLSALIFLLSNVHIAAEVLDQFSGRPNIVFIFADDWGYGDLGVHGSRFLKTPNLDAMAAEGTDFQNFWVNNPVCSPSRAAIMTGQFPARHRIHGHFSHVASHVERGMPDWLDPEQTMLPRLLQEAGYKTGHFGKWHLTNTRVPDAPTPSVYGFDEYGAYNLSGEQMPVEATCSRTIDFIRRHKDQPFFVNVWIHETHTPHYPKEKYLQQFDHLGEQERVYAAVVAEADAEIGRILNTLDELGLTDNTLVIFSSDNGPEVEGGEAQRYSADASTGPGLGRMYSVGETGGLSGQKRSLLAGGLRVPFIACWPGQVPAGRVDRTAVMAGVDLLPTFSALANASLPAGFQPDGENILPALAGGDFERTKPLFWEWRNSDEFRDWWPRYGVQAGQWRMVMNGDASRLHLYDMEEDWVERHNLAAAHPDVVDRLRAKLKEWVATLPTGPAEAGLSAARGDL
ncbi:N-acetylgalactosamine 6-sulfate sulfatase (GALNS) [Coraliomargarita sinensis]|uniref:N-acetylgalactosamine 6-sulfate sulfatase (GALNS) n=2 Tax=Coraliomargarita sinensis TaxID=2174842 RepID=A0A317ZE33_9BACT|nr:N-acetylgalactosamine 6-sulfate sulfatase (GALNS) [Coraliomargarita sinensis]